jgi:hypothetical protein
MLVYKESEFNVRGNKNLMKRLFFNLSVIGFACITAASVHSQCCHPGECCGEEDLEERIQDGEYESRGCCQPYFRGTHQIKEPYGNEASYPSQRSGDLYDQLSQ